MPLSLEDEPKGPEKIIKIHNCRKRNGQYEYLITRADYKQEWVNADEVDKNPYYERILKLVIFSNF